MRHGMYRVVETVTIGVTNPYTFQYILWRGYDINLLRLAFPVNGILGDELAPYTAQNGYIRHDFKFERFDPQEVWVRCDDPRSIIPEVEPVDFTDEEIELYNCGGLVLGRKSLWS